LGEFRIFLYRLPYSILQDQDSTTKEATTPSVYLHYAQRDK
jgi:hypothetical protein